MLLAQINQPQLKIKYPQDSWIALSLNRSLRAHCSLLVLPSSTLEMVVLVKAIQWENSWLSVLPPEKVWCCPTGICTLLKAPPVWKALLCFLLSEMTAPHTRCPVQLHHHTPVRHTSMQGGFCRSYRAKVNRQGSKGEAEKPVCISVRSYCIYFTSQGSGLHHFSSYHVVPSIAVSLYHTLKSDQTCTRFNSIHPFWKRLG